MRSPHWNDRPVEDVAATRIAASSHPARYRACIQDALAAMGRGQDLGNARWTTTDPVRVAAEIEALAGARRLAHIRKDTSDQHL